jgi:hypothetical protein
MPDFTYPFKGYRYSNIEKLSQKNKETGECLNGAYFWATDMILVDEVSRKRIEEVVTHLIIEDEFDQIFKLCEPEIEECGD